MRYRGKLVATITPEDIGKSTLRRIGCTACGSKIVVSPSAGPMQARDVGKQVWRFEGVDTMENDEQLRSRTNGTY